MVLRRQVDLPQRARLSRGNEFRLLANPLAQLVVVHLLVACRPALVVQAGRLVGDSWCCPSWCSTLLGPRRMVSGSSLTPATFSKFKHSFFSVCSRPTAIDSA